MAAVAIATPRQPCHDHSSSHAAWKKRKRTTKETVHTSPTTKRWAAAAETPKTAPTVPVRTAPYATESQHTVEMTQPMVDLHVDGNQQAVSTRSATTFSLILALLEGPADADPPERRQHLHLACKAIGNNKNDPKVGTNRCHWPTHSAWPATCSLLMLTHICPDHSAAGQEERLC